ncbi:MAG: GNAT family N-acetyltransferase, partial [Muribaculaceae bacterium]|nr:GNAT family N-acetyltransferase [Muribaculaceae bacterium]
ALLGVIDWCKSNLNLDSLLITADAANIASQRVAVKCGFALIADIDNDGIPTKVFRIALA